MLKTYIRFLHTLKINKLKFKEKVSKLVECYYMQRQMKAFNQTVTM